MGKIIACVNEKGGVSKTTTIKNVSIGLAMLKKKVLVIDMDPSMNFTCSLSIETNDETGSICEIIDRTIEMKEIPEGYGIQHHREMIDVIGCSERMHDIESKLGSAMQREIVLRRYLMTIKDKYDYIFLDCPAGLGIFTVNALFAADELIIPMQPHILSIEAIQNLFKKIFQVRQLNGTGNKPEVLGGLFTQVRTSTNNDKKLMEQLREQYGQYMNFFKTIIPLTSKLPESDIAKCSIYVHAPHSVAAMVHADLVYEILQIEERNSLNG